MSLDKFLQIFVTKETKFFPLYIKQAEKIHHATHTLLEMVRTDDFEEQKILGRQIKKDETDGDELFRTIYKELNNTFITPFDREDVHELATNMDDFLDIIEDCSKSLLMYKPKKIDKQIIEIMKLMDENAKYLVEMTNAMTDISKNANVILVKCVRIKQAEHTIDDIYTDYISHLFESETDYIELIKNKNIIETFEAASDTAKTVSDTIRTIIIKKS